MRRRILLVLLCLMLLLGCACRAPMQPEPAAPPELPEPEPESEPALPPLEEGGPIAVNGRILMTVQWEGEEYLAADELAAALGMEFAMDGTKATLSGLCDAVFCAGGRAALVDSVQADLAVAPFERDGRLYLPLHDAAAALAFGEYADEQTGERYLAPGLGSWEIPPEHEVTILEYHAVSNDLWGMESLFVDPAEMERQIVWLLDNGYTPIWFEDLRHVERYEKPVVLTFDDGYRDNYTELFPILQKYQVKATCFIIVNAIGNEHNLTAAQIRELADSGLVSIQSHTITHHDLAEMDEPTLRYELAESQRQLAALTGRVPCAISFPRGALAAETMDIYREYYRFGTKNAGKPYDTSTDPLLTSRFNVPRDMTLEEFAAMLTEKE